MAIAIAMHDFDSGLFISSAHRGRDDDNGEFRPTAADRALTTDVRDGPAAEGINNMMLDVNDECGENKS